MSVTGYFGGEGAMKHEVKERASEMKMGAINMEQENVPETKPKKSAKKAVKQSLED